MEIMIVCELRYNIRPMEPEHYYFCIATNVLNIFGRI